MGLRAEQGSKGSMGAEGVQGWGKGGGQGRPKVGDSSIHQYLVPSGVLLPLNGEQDRDRVFGAFPRECHSSPTTTPVEPCVAQ